MLLLISIIPLYTYGTGASVAIKVKDKDHVVAGSGDNMSGKYLVYAEGETFENEDSFMHWKFNSSDVQGQLDRGARYRVKVYGWRIPFFSWYRNIVEIEETLSEQ